MATIVFAEVYASSKIVEICFKKEMDELETHLTKWLDNSSKNFYNWIDRIIHFCSLSDKN